MYLFLCKPVLFTMFKNTHTSRILIPLYYGPFIVLLCFFHIRRQFFHFTMWLTKIIVQKATKKNSFHCPKVILVTTTWEYPTTEQHIRSDQSIHTHLHLHIIDTLKNTERLWEKSNDDYFALIFFNEKNTFAILWWSKATYTSRILLFMGESLL